MKLLGHKKVPLAVVFRVFGGARLKVSFRLMGLLVLMFGGAINVYAQQRSLYNDVRAHEVGDVLTVILTENISGSSSTNAATTSNTDGSAKSSVGGNFLPFKPVFGADAQFKYNSDERITADQQQLLSGTLSVRIKDVKENGEFIIDGKRSTEINGEKHLMTLKGFVRPSDISQANRVLSYRIADAQIKYQKKGGKQSIKNRPGFGRKVLWGALVLITGGAVFMAGN